MSKIPESILSQFEKAIEGLSFGRASLEVIAHDRHVQYKILREDSIVPGKPTSGGGGNE
jgi:hypothetical protein